MLKPWLAILPFVTFFEISPTFPGTPTFECTRNRVVRYTVKSSKAQWRCSSVFIVNLKQI